MHILIGGAWPYANGSLHVGHLAALLPGDVLARYHRKKGDQVLYVSGSDCHGTPISVRAQAEGVSPEVITNQYHKEFKDCFQKLGFSYDYYTRTDATFHHEEVQKLVQTLYKNKTIYEKETEQVYCESCQQFLPDRFVEGTCPICGEKARGDQCDACQSLLDPLDLKERQCKTCGSTPVIKPTKQLYFALSQFEDFLKAYVEREKSNWRVNAYQTAIRYIGEGLKDRAITRDLPWGITVPIPGYEEKKIYVWIDAVLGYLTTSKAWALSQEKDYEGFWQEDTLSYYVHGKDNIPFHNIILPALLEGVGIKGVPKHIVSSEYLTIEGRKLSTSQNWAVWVHELLAEYRPDVIRYFLLANGPEKRDADFSYRELVTLNNADLVGAYGNLVNRTLAFILKSYEGKIEPLTIDTDLQNKFTKLYETVGELIQGGAFKQALKEIFEAVRGTNKYFDEQKPWVIIKEDQAKCYHILIQCVYSIINLANLLEPFLPFTSNQVLKKLGSIENTWATLGIQAIRLDRISILFERLDKITVLKCKDFLD